MVDVVFSCSFFSGVLEIKTQEKEKNENVIGSVLQTVSLLFLHVIHIFLQKQLLAVNEYLWFAWQRSGLQFARVLIFWRANTRAAIGQFE